jgi:glycosyltransferase involved in cell wall biosynthesis
MKILHILSGFYPTQGGVETLVTSLSHELLNQYQINSVFVAPRYWKSRPDNLTYKSHRVYSIDLVVYKGNKGSFELKAAKAAMKSLNDLRKIFEIEKPDLVHVHGVFELFSAASIITKDFKIPIVHHIHGELPRNFEDRRKEILRTSPCVIAVSEKVAKNISLHIPDSKIEVIPNGVSDPGTADVFRSISQVTFIGRLDVQKGLHIALEALAGFIRRDVNLHLNIVGIGDHLHFQSMVANLGISANVTFHGRCSQSVTLEILKSTQLVIVPSTSIEGFSLVAAEANFMSIPVIASDVGGLSHTIIHGVTGLIVPPSDTEKLVEAIAYYLENPLIAASHGLAGRRRIDLEFSLLRYTQRMHELYQKQKTAQEKVLNRGQSGL